jgi:hypothetical protein
VISGYEIKGFKWDNAPTSASDPNTIAGSTASWDSVTYDRTVYFIYELPSANVTISKTVTGSMGDKTKSFKFTLSLSGLAANQKYNYTGGLTSGSGTTEKPNDGSLTADSNGKKTEVIYLKHGQTLTINGLPTGAIIKITEVEDTYTTTYKDSADTDSTKVHNGKTTGDITLGSGQRTISFFNDRDDVPITGIGNLGNETETILFLTLLITSLALTIAVKIRRKQLA